MKYRIINALRHFVNKFVAPFVVFFTKANFIAKITYHSKDDVTAVVTLPGTRFAEVFAMKAGCDPLRFQVGMLDASTEVTGITTSEISFRIHETCWSSPISKFVSGLHFSRRDDD